MGEDPLGRVIVATLSREGIDVGFFPTRPNVASAICVCFVGDDGETSFVWHIDDEMRFAGSVLVGGAETDDEP